MIKLTFEKETGDKVITFLKSLKLLSDNLDEFLIYIQAPDIPSPPSYEFGYECQIFHYTDRESLLKKVDDWDNDTLYVFKWKNTDKIDQVQTRKFTENEFYGGDPVEYEDEDDVIMLMEISISCRSDVEEKLFDIFECITGIGNYGHSFMIHVNPPDSESGDQFILVGRYDSYRNDRQFIKVVDDQKIPDKKLFRCDNPDEFTLRSHDNCKDTTFEIFWDGDGSDHLYDKTVEI